MLLIIHNDTINEHISKRLIENFEASLGGIGQDSPFKSGLLWQLQKSELAHMHSISELTPSQLVVSALLVQQSLNLTTVKETILY